MPSPSLDQLKRAIDIKEQIESLETELAGILEGTSTTPAKRKYTKRTVNEHAATAPKAKKTRRPMSEEGRAKIIAAQKARWAKIKKEKKDK